MSEIDSKTVEKIAKLANLHLEPKELEQLAGQLENILEYIHKLNQLNTLGISETTHALPMSNVWRADLPTPSLNRDSALASAPEVRDGFFRVPRIIE
jgi:aspartyl-tRNA(Asn)/glutamyl-tRNA(Gln) amidotransferase subunit C